jgi:hypothetical protein
VLACNWGATCFQATAGGKPSCCGRFRACPQPGSTHPYLEVRQHHHTQPIRSPHHPGDACWPLIYAAGPLCMQACTHDEREIMFYLLVCTPCYMAHQVQAVDGAQQHRNMDVVHLSTKHHADLLALWCNLWCWLHQLRCTPCLIMLSSPGWSTAQICSRERLYRAQQMYKELGLQDRELIRSKQEYSWTMRRLSASLMISRYSTCQYRAQGGMQPGFVGRVSAGVDGCKHGTCSPTAIARNRPSGL